MLCRTAHNKHQHDVKSWLQIKHFACTKTKYSSLNLSVLVQRLFYVNRKVITIAFKFLVYFNHRISNHN